MSGARVGNPGQGLQFTMAENEPDFSQSKRSIDFYIADKFGRLDERIKNLSDRIDGIHRKTSEAHEEIFGGPHGQVGLAEQLRGVIKAWGIAAILLGNTVAGLAWLWDHVLRPVGEKPIFGDRIQEKWARESTRRIRLRNPETGKYEIYYMIEEHKE